MTKRQAKVILCKCSRINNRYDNLFGVRTEKIAGQWICTWAFKIDEARARHEGFDRECISVSGTDDKYPGCPYCGNKSFTQDSECGKLSCYDGHSSKATCAWCGTTSLVDTVDSLDVKGGGF